MIIFTACRFITSFVFSTLILLAIIWGSRRFDLLHPEALCNETESTTELSP